MIFTLITLNSFAQTFRDRIYTTEGDSIFCIITKIEKGWIYYDFQGKKELKNKFIHTDDVRSYIMKGNLYELHVHKYAKGMYSEVVVIDSAITKKELFSSFMDWFSKYYVSAQNVIQYQDKEEGKIVGKGIFFVRAKRASSLIEDENINHTISIFAKDGKYKYTIESTFTSTNKEVVGYDIGNPVAPKWYPQLIWNGIREQSYFEIQEIINSLKMAALNSKNSTDW